MCFDKEYTSQSLLQLGKIFWPMRCKPKVLRGTLERVLQRSEHLFALSPLSSCYQECEGWSTGSHLDTWGNLEVAGTHEVPHNLWSTKIEGIWAPWLEMPHQAPDCCCPPEFLYMRENNHIYAQTIVLLGLLLYAAKVNPYPVPSYEIPVRRLFSGFFLDIFLS